MRGEGIRYSVFEPSTLKYNNNKEKIKKILSGFSFWPMFNFFKVIIKHGQDVEYLDRINAVQSPTGKIISPLFKILGLCWFKRYIRDSISTLHHTLLFSIIIPFQSSLKCVLKRFYLFLWILLFLLLLVTFFQKISCFNFLKARGSLDWESSDKVSSLAMGVGRALSSAHLCHLLLLVRLFQRKIHFTFWPFLW